MAALRRLVWPPPRLPPTLSPHQPFLGPWGRPAGTALPGRPFSRREDEEGAVAEAAWRRRRRRWGELSFAAAAGGGLVGLVCYRLYGDPGAEPGRARLPGRPSESAAAEPEDLPHGRGLLPIPVAAAKETDLALYNSRLFHKGKMTIKGKPFGLIQDIERATTAQLKTFIKRFPERLQKVARMME